MSLRQSLLLSFLLPAALLGGALGFQYIGGYLPCAMCLQQRWPHGIAIVLAILGLLTILRARFIARATAVLTPMAIAVSGAIAVYHSGVERKWWQGPPCASAVDPNLPPLEYMKAIQEAALINCHDIPWQLFGLSMANYNAILSSLGGAALLVIAVRSLSRDQSSSSVSQ